MPWVAPCSSSELTKKLECVHPFTALRFFQGCIEVREFFRTQLDFFFRFFFYRPLFHDVPNGTSDAGVFAFASSRVNQRFVIFSTTVFWRRRARRLVKSTASRCWS